MQAGTLLEPVPAAIGVLNTNGVLGTNGVFGTNGVLDTNGINVLDTSGVLGTNGVMGFSIGLGPVVGGMEPPVGKRVRKPCSKCIHAKVGCDHKRPCSRCVKRGEADQCMDIVRKQRASKKNVVQPIPPTATVIESTDSAGTIQLFSTLQSYPDLTSFLDNLVDPASDISPAVLDSDGGLEAELLNVLSAEYDPATAGSCQPSGDISTDDIIVSGTCVNEARCEDLCSSTPISPTMPSAMQSEFISEMRKELVARPIPRGITQKLPRAIFSIRDNVVLDCNSSFAELMAADSPRTLIGLSLRNFVPSYAYHFAERSLQYFVDNNIDHYERLSMFTSKKKAKTWTTIQVDMLELSFSMSVLEVHDTVPACFRSCLQTLCGVKDAPRVHAQPNCPRSHCQCKVVVTK